MNNLTDPYYARAATTNATNAVLSDVGNKVQMAYSGYRIVRAFRREPNIACMAWGLIIGGLGITGFFVYARPDWTIYAATVVGAVLFLAGLVATRK